LEIPDQLLLASASSGLTDANVASNRQVLFEFVDFLGRPCGRQRVLMPTGF
jgi:hypothetical protein